VENYTGTGTERVDRLTILVSGQNVVKLLPVPKVQDSTAVTIDFPDHWWLGIMGQNCGSLFWHHSFKHENKRWSMH